MKEWMPLIDMVEEALVRTRVSGRSGWDVVLGLLHTCDRRVLHYVVCVQVRGQDRDEWVCWTSYARRARWAEETCP